MNNMNYQKELDKIIAGLGDKRKLLLHSCCAPCSSYVLEYLSEYFDITVLYYNPNITYEEEYKYRKEEQKRLISQMPEGKHKIDFMDCDYEPKEFFDKVKGYEKEPEGGARCKLCFELRLKKTAELAAENGFDWFTTTLSISPLKNAQLLNEIGQVLAREYNVPYLVSDFKKKNGYKRSIELSKEYDLYRQDYCGCIYSKLEREKADD
ncbi:MAG: epoxyqueuosine reductase QueH [Lachnospiraceae bacterium]|nr:epoxyqueuosine reductase QueH [Lachnospiraceae bacterium]